MRSMRYLAVAVSALITIIGLIVYSACNKDKCHNVNCLNQGVCNSGACVCPPGFEGSRCQTLSRTKFISTYNGYDLCRDSVHTQYSVYMLAVLSDSQTLVLHNFLNNVYDSAICTVVTADSFLLQGSNNGTVYSGYGTLHADSLHMAYHVQIDTVQYDCEYFGRGL